MTAAARRVSIEVTKLNVAVALARTLVGRLFRLQRRRLIVPVGLPRAARSEQGTKGEQWQRHAASEVDICLESHGPFCRASAGLEWPRDVGGMSSLVRAGCGEKSRGSCVEEVVRDPQVVGRDAGVYGHCSMAGNGRASHQAWWASDSRSHTRRWEQGRAGEAVWIGDASWRDGERVGIGVAARERAVGQSGSRASGRSASWTVDHWCLGAGW